MDIDRRNPLPLYHQVKLLLLEKIKTQEWKVGATVPSENELRQHLDVSRATVRQAIMELVQTGHLRRIQGKGTIVTEPKVEPIGALTSFTENMRAAGIIPSRRTLHLEWLSPPQDVSSHLFAGQTPSPQRKALFIERVLIADGAPLALQRCWLPRWLVEACPQRFTKDYLDAHSLYRTFEEDCGVTLARAEETLDVILPNGHEQKLLAVPAAQPLMVIHRKTSDANGQPIEFVELLFRSDRYRYKVSLSREPYRGQEVMP